MPQLRYTVEGLTVRANDLTVGITVRAQTWIKFGMIHVPFDMFEAEHLRALIAAWSDRMEGPPEEDTPLF